MRTIKLLLVLLLPMHIAKPVFSQESKLQTTREVILVYTDSVINCGINLKIKTIKTKNNLTYYWFNNDNLYYNQGGYSGKLLNGKSTLYDKQKRLRREGVYSDGLKDGEWKTWSENGILTSIVLWDKGERTGKSYYYDNRGNLKKIIPYKNDRIHGTMIVYQGNTVEKIKYRNGTAVVKKDRKKRTKAINNNKEKSKEVTENSKKKSTFKFFRKKEKDDKPATEPNKSVSTNETGKKKRSLFKIFSKKERKTESTPKGTGLNN